MGTFNKFPFFIKNKFVYLFKNNKKYDRSKKDNWFR